MAATERGNPMTNPLRRINTDQRTARFDPLNLREYYASDNLLGIPYVLRYDDTLPNRWHAWPDRKRATPLEGIHCFTDDYRFEPLWRSPDRYKINDRIICSPDFSIYPEWPLAAKQWQVFRSRWLARALQVRGAHVIPSVSWADPESWKYCFLGLPQDSTIAISAYGASRNPVEYREGFEAMRAALHPTRIVCIGGKLPEWLAPHVTYYPSLHVERLHHGRQRIEREHTTITGDIYS